jgi:hypothetical protein
MNVASYSYKEYQKARNPIDSKVKSWFGGGDIEMDVGNVFTDAKNAYHKKILKNKVGNAVRKSGGNVLGDVYDDSENELERNI